MRVLQSVDASIESKELFDNSRVTKDLGVTLHTPEQTLTDTLQAAVNLM